MISRIEFRYQDKSYRQRVYILADGNELAISEKICPLCRWFCGERFDCRAGAAMIFEHMAEDFDREIEFQWQQRFPQTFHGPEFYTHCRDCGKAFTLSQMIEPYYCGCSTVRGDEDANR